MTNLSETTVSTSVEAQARAIGCVPVQGEPGYFVHPDGVIYSGGRGRLKELKIHRGHHAYYLSVGFGDNSMPRRAYNAGWLVASHFVLNPKKLHHLIHIDRDPKNIRADNLVWVENARLFANNNLTIQDIANIERLHGYQSRQEISERYGIPKGKISEIWAHARKMGRITTDRRGNPLIAPRMTRTVRSA